MTVRHAIKGFETHMHDDAGHARTCTQVGGPDRYWLMVDEKAEADAEYAAELAAERTLENAGYWETALQEADEARRGVVDFITAWHLASPETCPCERTH